MKELPMSCFFYSCLTIFFAFSLGVAQDISGKWKGQMQSPGGPMDLTFTFKVSGDTLTGTVESPMGELPISNAKKNGNAFSFDVNVGDMTINHLCTVMSDSISMKIPGMQGDTATEIILKRLSESK